jgi:hypothetical protein
VLTYVISREKLLDTRACGCCGVHGEYYPMAAADLPMGSVASALNWTEIFKKNH